MEGQAAGDAPVDSWSVWDQRHHVCASRHTMIRWLVASRNLPPHPLWYGRGHKFPTTDSITPSCICAQLQTVNVALASWRGPASSIVTDHELPHV